MPLWGKTDVVADAPKTRSADEASKTYFVDTTEAGVAANRAKGIKTPGWNTYSTYTDSDGNTRNKVETLVAMKVASGDSGDVGSILTEAPDAIVGVEYTIVTPGNTDFTVFGAADSDADTVFTANNVGTGTGTMRPTEDDVVADS